MRERHSKIVSFLKSIIEKAEGRGRTVKTMYVPSTLYGEFRLIEEYFEEFSMEDILNRGIYGKFLSVDICVTSRIGDRIVLSGKEYQKETPIPPMKKGMSKEDRIEYYKQNRINNIEQSKRFEEMVESSKCTEFDLKEILDKEIRTSTPLYVSSETGESYYLLDNDKRMTHKEFEEKIEQWHIGNSTLQLHQFLNMSEKEYADCVEMNNYKKED